MGTVACSAISTSRNFSVCGALLAKARAIGSCPTERTLIPNRPWARRTSSVREPRSRQASISGGSSDSEHTALAVAPAGPCSPTAVTIVTPVGSAAMARRKCSGVGVVTIGQTGSMMPPVLRRICIPMLAIGIALAASGCGTQGIQVAQDDPDYAGAVLFSDRCSGCHSLDAAGAQGSANRALRNQGPNLNERIESADDVLYAIRNGGFS